ncbi:MAG: response regulator [Bacteroidetes bacterium]|nr:response regulator [Bacteroidota bacterium]
MVETNLNRLHILIAEDDEDDAETIKQTFEDHTCFYKVDMVKNGEQLVAFLKNDKTKLPDLILTDFNMPLMNGYEALQEISNNNLFKSIPVFIYSTTINPLYVTQCKAIGAKDFLVKPFNLNHFDLIPEKILEILMNTNKSNT